MVRGRGPDLQPLVRGSAPHLEGIAAASFENAVPFWGTWSTSLFVEGIDTVSRLGEFEIIAFRSPKETERWLSGLRKSLKD